MTERELRDPMLLTRPMRERAWYLRSMILEADRRAAVLAGRPDPAPGAPWRHCDPAELREWQRTHPKNVTTLSVSTGRDNYGMRGHITY